MHKSGHAVFRKEYIPTLLPYPSMLPALEIIPEKRRKLGLTQSQLAELAGVSQSYIAKLEAGNIEPSYVKVKALFEALDRLEQEKHVSAGQIMNRSVVGRSCRKEGESLIPEHLQLKGFGITNYTLKMTLIHAENLGAVSE